MSVEKLIATLNDCEQRGFTADLWLRDDDAVEPTEALERLLRLSNDFSAPVTLAVIPEITTEKLADRLSEAQLATVAVHGWSHRNYASDGEKKQELGGHRNASIALGELQVGLEKLRHLHSGRFVPMLVPPWNRIDPGVVQGLPDLGFRAVSVFGPEKLTQPASLNTHVDVIDWHGTRGGRSHDILFAETADRITRTMESGRTTGILTHHLVHDESVWQFLTTLFEVTTSHPACRWRSSAQLVEKLSP